MMDSKQTPSEQTCRGCHCEPLKYTAWYRESGGEFEAPPLFVDGMKKDESNHFTKSDVVIIYAEGDKVRNCHNCKTIFDETFCIPPIWWTTLSRRSNGYFGYDNVLDASGKTRKGTISWVRFLMKQVNSTDSGHHNKNDINYKWVKLNAFVRWHVSKGDAKGRTEIILFDHPEFAQQVGDSILSSIHSQSKACDLSDPFWAYPAMVEEVAALHDVCVWESRTLIRNYEKQRTHYRDPFDYLHEVSRHSLHINETLHVAESILDSMQKYHDHFTATESSSSKKENYFDHFPQSIKNRLGHLQTTLTHLRHRAESNHERVKAEITLSFNKSAQIESGATRTISLAGLLFLPAAYITALFSTSFFNYDAPTGIWGFSGKFWIYWAVTLPVTALTIFLWFFGATLCEGTRALFQDFGNLGVHKTIMKRRRERDRKEEEKRKKEESKKEKIRLEEEREKKEERKKMMEQAKKQMRISPV